MLHTPVLQLDAARMQEIDPRNVESLFGMWAVFNKCAGTIREGKRLENMSWRLWARETLCCPPQPEKTIVPAIDIPLPPLQDVPELSNSVTSDTSDEEHCLKSSSSSTASSDVDSDSSAMSKSRGKEAHLTPLALTKIVNSIQECPADAPLSSTIEAVVAEMSPQISPKEDMSSSKEAESQHTNPSVESSCISTTATAESNSTAATSEHRNSDTSNSSNGLIRSGSVVHGFTPVSSFRSSSITKHLPILKKAGNNKLSPQKHTGFVLGVSSDDESSFGSHMPSMRLSPAEPRKSSLSHNLSRELPSNKKTSFKEVVEQRKLEIVEGSENDEGAIASDSDDDFVSDDDDDAVIDEDAWEDSNTDDEKPLSRNDFKRIDSSANLTSRRSVLTQGLTEGDRAKGMLTAAAKSSPALRRQTRAASGPSLPGSPERDDEDGGMMMQAPSGSKPLPILANNSNTYAAAHSPRTTRRHMMSSELTESLRKNLLWERQQKNTTVNAFHKREARSMANLQRAGQAPPVQQTRIARGPTTRDPQQNNSWNDYFNVANEYHRTGW